MSIRLAPDFGTNAVSKLIDATPETATFEDAPLTTDQTYTDSSRGVSFTVSDVVPGESAAVTVTFTSSTTGPTKPGKGNNK